MAINVEINRENNESNMGLLKKFSRQVRESGVLKYSRKIRYAIRNESDFVKKRNKLHSINKATKIEEQIKLGKIIPGQGRRR